MGKFTGMVCTPYETSGQLAVTVLVLLATATGTRLVSTDTRDI